MVDQVIKLGERSPCDYCGRWIAAGSTAGIVKVGCENQLMHSHCMVHYLVEAHKLKTETRKR